MKAAVLEKPAVSGLVNTGRVREIVLVRVASAARGAAKGDVAGDLATIVAQRLSASQWRTLLEQEVDNLLAAGFVTVTGSRIEATDAGSAHATAFLGFKGNLPRSWNELRDVRLIAKALGLQREPAKRLKALTTPDGLRAAIVQRAYNLKIKGVATPSRLRSALATVALERAFGNKIKAGLGGKAGFSAKAGRLLAAQLARHPRDFGTDSRLIAALAAEHLGITQTDLAVLRLGLLRRFVDAAGERGAVARGPAAGVPPVARPRLVQPAPPIAAPEPELEPVAGRPDLAGFAREVRRHAASQAQGWAGNRRAYISHVWRHLKEARSEWGLSEIEFKCMLAEAHRAGQLALANADLKDNKSIKDVQDSAVVFKNSVFHFIRVDG
ncbi:MAG: hypothetical protein F9K29_08410 [Hyphomicrobiaceae bacterium]|nr:MAG: hypothetical protein F9K29_08410 [Hyphomicrobiaceae bacterium]